MFQRTQKTFLFIMATPVSAIWDAKVLSYFFLPQLEIFDLVWDDQTLNYQMFATISFASTCDWTPGSLLRTMGGTDPLDNEGVPQGWGNSDADDTADFTPYTETTCGGTCKLLTDYFDGRMPQAASIYSPSDHVSVTTFWKHSATCDKPVQGIPSGFLSENQCLIADAGSYFNLQDDASTVVGGIAWFLSFRGTYMWDIVNHRRNDMITMKLVSLCSLCAASDGPYRNFVSFRFSLVRVLSQALRHIPTTQQGNLAITGTSMGAQLALFASAFLSVEASLISQNVYSLITHGSPRVANKELARVIAAGVDVPYINFVMYRDPVPHFPPMAFGFRSASNHIVNMYVEPSFWAKAESGESLDSRGAIRYREFLGDSGEESFVASLGFYALSDHLLYFMELDSAIDMAACGGLADTFFKNSNAIRLYDA
jgi:hypothetical protein